MNVSFWDTQRYFSKWDVCIVGGGFTGLYTALFIKQQSPDTRIVVLEKEPLGAIASTKNAGFACFGSVTELLDDIKQTGWEQTINLAIDRYRGLQLMCHVLGKNAIDYQQNGGFELFRDNEKNLFEECLEEIPKLNQALSSIGESVFHRNKTNQFPFRHLSGIIENPYEGQVDTGKLYQTLERKVQNLGIEILRGVEVLGVKENNENVLVSGNGWELTANQVALCNNSWAGKFLARETILPARAQVLITEPIPDLNWKGTFHYQQGYYYFRNFQKRILIGGGRNLDITGETTTEMGLSETIQDSIEELLSNVIHNKPVKIAQRWSGTMAVGGDKRPIIQQLSERTFCGVKFGGMGVALSSLAGKQLAELMMD